MILLCVLAALHSIALMHAKAIIGGLFYSSEIIMYSLSLEIEYGLDCRERTRACRGQPLDGVCRDLSASSVVTGGYRISKKVHTEPRLTLHLKGSQIER